MVFSFVFVFFYGEILAKEKCWFLESKHIKVDKCINQVECKVHVMLWLTLPPLFAFIFK